VMDVIAALMALSELYFSRVLRVNFMIIQVVLIES